jgi:phage shock protein A
MPNIGLLLKQEIARLAKKEAKGLVKPASEHFTGMRKLVSQMKKKIAALEKKVAALEKSFAPRASRSRRRKASTSFVSVRPISPSFARSSASAGARWPSL